MNQILYNGWTFSDDAVGSGNYFSQTSLASSSLSINTLEASVKCPDPTITEFEQNSPVTYFHKGQQKGIYYLQSVERTGPDRYTLSCVSVMGLLSQRRHAGGIYTGHTVEEVVADICGDIPVQIKNNLRGIQLYGWLPYVAPPKASAKDNLSQVLFAIGAAVTNDLNGVLRIEPLWRGLSGVLDDGSVCEGGSVVTDSLVTAVSVTEHQYFKGTETKELFQGSTLNGDIITFGEPMHSLVADGFTILEQGANYAVVSAGSGTLSGSVYVHNTRQVTAAVAEGPVDNVKSVEDATLVSLVNSTAVVQRMAAYYRCRETIKVPAIIQAEHPGAVISIFHPYDKKQVRAAIVSSDVNMSAVLKSDLEALVDYEPPDVSQLEYYDAREVLTGEGEWTPPEGVTNVRYAMFSGAPGGKAGFAGKEASGSKNYSYSHYSSISGNLSFSGQVVLWGGPGGKGGEGGEGGSGPKMLEGRMDLTPGVKILFSCGVGGKGATFNAEAVEDGEEGAATTFGDLTTDDGTYPAESGWVDVITGEVFATPGPAGLPGGDGAGAPDNYTIPSGSAELNEILKYKPATGAVDEDGVEWPGGPTKEKAGQENVAYWETYKTSVDGTVGSYAGFALGPGGAVGVTLEESTVKGKNPVTSATAADGLQGATPAYAPRKAALTKGGRGGYGGGGGSCASWAGIEYTPDFAGTPRAYAGTPGPGGLGSDGGDGGDGCIILYYRIPRAVVSGAVMDRTFRFVRDRTGRLMIV